MKSLLFIISLVGMGCGASLRPDPIPAADLSNYPTAEVYVNGVRSVGIAATSIVKGAPLSGLNIAVQTYHKGQVRIFSETCAIDTFFRYTESGIAHVEVPGVASQSCLIGFSVAPEFPEEESNAVKIFASKGFVYVKVLEVGEVWSHEILKAQEGIDYTTHIDAPGGELVDIRGCGKELQKPVKDGTASIALSELGGLSVGNCIYSVTVLGTTVRFGSWLVWTYSKSHIPLPTPAIEWTSKDLSVSADPAVSLIALDQSYELGSEAEFQFNASKPHVLRLMTTGGRLIVGEYRSGRWVWKK